MTIPDNIEGYAAANLDAMSAAVTYQAAIRQLVAQHLSFAEYGGRTGYFIDFGAGKGEYARALSESDAVHISCVEPDDGLHAAYACNQVRHTDMALMRPAQALGAYSLNVFEHIQDDVAALKDLVSRCLPGACIFVLVPANPSLWTPMDTAVGHQRRYTPDSLRQLAYGAGLAVEAEGWFDHTGYFATRVLQLLMALGLRSSSKAGRISANQIRAFDRVFRVCEPILQKMKLSFGKNRWVALRIPK